MIVRKQGRHDDDAIAAVHRSAFRRGGDRSDPPEVGLVVALRRSDAWIPQLSLVAVVGGTVVGHVVTTRAMVAERFPALGLGPLAVREQVRGVGIGGALVHATIGAAEALGETLICVLGSPEYYGRFGFLPAWSARIDAPQPGWGDHFQALPLSAHRQEIRGRFRYAAPFDEL